MFKNPFSFNGRIQRTEYAISFVSYWVVYILVRVFQEQGGEYGLLGFVMVPFIWFLWAQGAKRCHDIDKNGWWQIIPFYFFVLLSRESNPDLNQYDPEFVEYGADDYERPYDADTLERNIEKSQIKEENI
jgi:uncharacterized membrane protein YhaH (DUF805 family)